MDDKTPEFALLWGRSQRQVASYIRGAVYNTHDAEDLFQEVVVVAARRFESYDRDKPFTPWVLGIARNLILTYFRTRKRDQIAFSEAALTVFAEAIAKQPDNEDERLAALRECLPILSREDRSVLDLRYAKGLTVHSIAQSIQYPPNRVSVILYRARRSLMTCIKRKLDAKGVV